MGGRPPPLPLRLLRLCFKVNEFEFSFFEVNEFKFEFNFFKVNEFEFELKNQKKMYGSNPA